MMKDIYGQIKLPFQGAANHTSIKTPKALPLGKIKLGFQPEIKLNMMNDICARIKLPFQGATNHTSIKIPKALPLGLRKLDFVNRPVRAT